MTTKVKAGIYKHKAYLASVMFPKVKSYKIALSILEWKYLMQKEFDALIANGTWELAPKPKNCKPIPSKWVFRVKLSKNGLLDKYKSRVITEGFLQV